jgi:GT2 family glycosyltransferase
MTPDRIHRLAMQAENSLGPSYQLIAAVLARHGARQGVEVGVSYGGNSESMLKRCGLERLYGVDAYRHRPDYNDPANVSQAEFDAIHAYAADRFKQFGNRYILIRAASEEAVSSVPDDLDFAYLDADHSFAGVRADLRHWFHKVRDGGIICGHDYGHPDFPGVRQAVDGFFHRFGWPVHVEGEGIWWTVKRPLPVSFFIPAFNCSQTLEESVASITATNSGPDDEIIIVDDGSTDATAACAERLSAGDGRVRLIRHRRNKGGASARNTAVEAARHAVLFCLDSDNVLERGSITGLHRCLIDNAADVAAFQELHYFCETPGTTTHIWRFKPGTIELQDYLAGTIVPGASGNYMFTTRSWERAGGYAVDAGALDTWSFGLRQVATGSRMITHPATRYFHRYGHDSYWIREAKAARTSLTALMLMIPYLEQLEDRDVEYLFSTRGRAAWFESLDRRPLRVRGTQTGVAGCSLPTSDPGKKELAISKKQRWPSPRRLLRWFS